MTKAKDCTLMAPEKARTLGTMIVLRSATCLRAKSLWKPRTAGRRVCPASGISSSLSRSITISGRIRIEDKWIPLDQFVSDHSVAMFSHGYCPECVEKHYGELLRKKA